MLGLLYAMAELGWYVPCSKFLLHPSLVCFAAKLNATEAISVYSAAHKLANIYDSIHRTWCNSAARFLHYHLVHIVAVG